MASLVRLADLASSEGRGDEARAMLREAVAKVRHFDSFAVAHAIHWTGVMDVRQGHSERGVSLMACAAAHWGSFGSRGTSRALVPCAPATRPAWPKRARRLRTTHSAERGQRVNG